VKLLCVVSRDTPANAEQAPAAPAQVDTELDPFPRLKCRYSAEMDHAPFNPISTPVPAVHPVELKFLPPSKDAAGVPVPAGIYVSVLLCDPSL
jgi:hypothetical protein